MSHSIHAFLITWNEMVIAKMVISHYQRFCDKVVIMDNYSTDGTPELAQKMGCEVRQFGNQFFDDQQNMICKNTCWKYDKADYNIVCDFDEVLYQIGDDPEDIRSTLHGSQHDVYKTIGWQIMSEQMPKDNLLEINTGYRFDNYSKSILFSGAITDMAFNPGAHKCQPVNCRGDAIDWGAEGLFYVLHYKHIGGLQRTIDRYNEYKKRMSPFNRKHGHGKHYFRSAASLKQEWNERMDKSKPLI